MKVKGVDRQERGTVLKGSKQPANPSGHKHRRWAAIAAITVVVLIAAVVGVVVTTGPSSSTPTKAVFAFKPQSYPSGLIVDRTWTLAGPSGDQLQGSATLSDGNSAAIKTDYTEVIPKLVASSVDRLSFSPTPDAIVRRDPVVSYDVALAPGETTKIGFTVNVGKTNGNGRHDSAN